MQCIRDLDADWAIIPKPVVTLGNYDGIHLGHQRILQRLRHAAGELDGSTVVVTFFPHPLKILSPERAPRLIISIEERLRLLEVHGIDCVICLRFTKEFSQWSPERFVKEIIADKLQARTIFVGRDYRFGKDRKGDVPLLERLGKKFGFDVQIIPPVTVESQEVSSTMIRRLTLEGNVKDSSKLLGRPHRIYGTIIPGKSRGKGLGFPTANLDTTAELIPCSGVYAVRVGLGSEMHPGVASLGTNPTFSGRLFSIEAYIIDFNEDIYGKEMSLDFIDRIRHEEKFSSPETLVRQIQQDVSRAKKILENDDKER